MNFLFLALAGYLLGSVPFGLVITRAVGIGDIRKIGSGNIGATNVLRTGRKGLAAATLLLDAAKGAVAVVIGMQFGPLGTMLAGVAAVLGHLYPVWLGFRGGKGVATGFGVLIAANPLAGLLCGAIWIAVAMLLKISSAASLTAFALAPVAFAIISGEQHIVALAVVVALLIWMRHHGNIERLIARTEPRIGK